MAGKHEVATRIPRVTFASMVGERIRSNIIDGTLPPGSQLNEVELASSFGVSRGPVREALQRLIQEGLLRSEPHRGVFVPVMTDEDIDDVYLAREALETAAVRRIARMGWSASAFKALDSIVRGDAQGRGRRQLADGCGPGPRLPYRAGLGSGQPSSGTHVHDRDLRDPAVPQRADEGL